MIDFEYQPPSFEDACDSFVLVDRAHMESHMMLGVCGCGTPEPLLRRYHKVMRVVAARDDYATYTQKMAEASDGNEEWGEMMLHALDAFGLTEHGGSVAGSWLTDDGKRCLECLDVIEQYDYEPSVASPG